MCIALLFLLWLGKSIINLNRQSSFVNKFLSNYKISINHNQPCALKKKMHELKYWIYNEHEMNRRLIIKKKFHYQIDIISHNIRNIISRYLLHAWWCRQPTLCIVVCFFFFRGASNCHHNTILSLNFLAIH